MPSWPIVLRLVLKVPGTCQDAVWLSGGTSTQYSNTSQSTKLRRLYTLTPKSSLPFLYFILGAMSGC